MVLATIVIDVHTRPTLVMVIAFIILNGLHGDGRCGILSYIELTTAHERRPLNEADTHSPILRSGSATDFALRAPLDPGASPLSI